MAGTAKERGMVPLEPTHHKVNRGAVVYATLVDGGNYKPGKDDWRGFMTSNKPVFLNLAPETGAKIFPLEAAKATHHLRLDTIPNNEEIEAILDSYAEVAGKALPAESIEGKTGEKIAEAIADNMVNPERVDFRKGESLLAKRAIAIRSVLKVAGYQGTAQLLNPEAPDEEMRLSFFEPETKLKKGNEDSETVTQAAVENHHRSTTRYVPFRT